MGAFLFEDVWIILVAFLGILAIGIIGKQRSLVGFSSILGFALSFAILLSVDNPLYFFATLILSFYLLYHSIVKM